MKEKANNQVLFEQVRALPGCPGERRVHGVAAAGLVLRAGGGFRGGMDARDFRVHSSRLVGLGPLVRLGNHETRADEVGLRRDKAAPGPARVPASRPPRPRLTAKSLLGGPGLSWCPRRAGASGFPGARKRGCLDRLVTGVQGTGIRGGAQGLRARAAPDSPSSLLRVRI
jgi:hypothetical protein